LANYLKLHRKMLEWGWYSDINTRILFFHCLLKTNWKAGEWCGIKFSAGQFITSLQTLANETGLSVQQVRTALQHLVSTGELTSYQQGKARVITVNNWNEYQIDNKVDNKEVTGCQQDDNKELTTDIDIKNKRIKDKKNIYGEYGHVKLTEAEWDKLCNEFGNDDTREAIKFLDEYIEMKGYKAKSHYLALRKWVFDAVKRDKEKDKGKVGGQAQFSETKEKKIHSYPERDVDYAAIANQIIGN